MRMRLVTLIILSLGLLSLRAEHLTDSVRVHFRVNKTEIDTLLMGNDAAMRGFTERLRVLKDLKDLNDLKDSKDTKDTVIINSILITGAASPEGSIPYNKWLSERRAEAITRWLGTYFEIPDSITTFTFKGRDWQGLLAAVIDDPDVPNKKEVIDLLIDIRNDAEVGLHPGASAKKRDGVTRLKALHGGVPYRYLLRKHFPVLRASEVFITATVKPMIVDKDLKNFNDLKDVTNEIDSIAVPDSLMVSEIEIQAHPESKAEYGYFFALKTNMLYDAALIPNIGAEFPIGKHLSVGANWMYAWWKNHDRNRHWRIYGGDVNARYYFGSRAKGTSLQGHHVGVNAQVLLFQVAFGAKGYITGIPGQDIWGKPWFGGSVEYGFSMRLAHRLNIDFTIGAGYIGGEYREYLPVDGCYVWHSTHRMRWFGPTKAEISLVWLIGKGVPK